MMATTDCFGCCPKPSPDRTPEVPWDWSSPRFLCASHKTLLKVEDGQLLDKVLDGAAPGDHPLEGSLLAWIFNPVFFEQSDGRRVLGWTDFVAGGMAVYEDRFGAESYFEFRAFEVASAVDLLYTLRSVIPSGASMVTLPDVVRAIAVVSNIPPDARGPTRGPFAGLSDLIPVWNFQRRLQQVRLSYGHLWPESFVELTNWTKTCTENYETLDSDAETSFVGALTQLVMRRFEEAPNSPMQPTGSAGG